MARTFSVDRDNLRHRREFNDDDLLPLDSLSLDDGYDTDQRRESARRRREYELRRQNGSILSEDVFARDPPYLRRGRVGSDYVRLHEGGPHVIEVSDHSPAASFRGLDRSYMRRYP